MAKGNRWQQRQDRDPYVARARREGYRNRAAYKLLQLDERDRFLQPGAVVVDLGAAPGGWTQVACRRVAPGGRVIALDRLAMEPVPGAEVLEADFAEEAGLQALRRTLGEAPVDTILSDMAPALSGIKAADQARSMELADLAMELADEVLRPGGTLVLKAFQGEGFPERLATLRSRFRTVAPRKPDASRAASPEQYLVALGRAGS